MSVRRVSLLAVLLLAVPARASVVEPLDLPALSRGADLIVRGQVVRAVSTWDGDHIVTRSTIEVRRVWKGRAGRTVVVRTLGGVVGTIGQKAPGEASLAPGEEVILFLEAAGGGEFLPAGMALGKFAVSGDGWATQDLAGLTLARRDAAGVVLVEPRPLRLPVRELEARVRRLVAR